MTIVKQNAGIDLSKKDFKVTFSQLLASGRIHIAGSRTFKNTLKGIESLMAWIAKKEKSGIEVRFIPKFREKQQVFIMKI